MAPSNRAPQQKGDRFTPRAHMSIVARSPSEKDRLILQAISQNPTKSSPKEVAEATGLYLSTVTKRLRKLEEIGAITTVVNPHWEYGYRALVSIDLDLVALNGQAYGYTSQHGLIALLSKGLSVIPEFAPYTSKAVVEEVFTLLGGRADIAAIVAGKDVAAVYNFVTHVLHALPGVRNTNTATIAPTVP